jgi:hypothetical protein
MSHAMMTPKVFVSPITILVVMMMRRRRWTVMIWNILRMLTVNISIYNHQDKSIKIVYLYKEHKISQNGIDKIGKQSPCLTFYLTSPPGL